MRRTTTALSIPVFRRVWAGATVSAVGDAASWVALVGLALGTAHASLPLLAALYTAPGRCGRAGGGLGARPLRPPPADDRRLRAPRRCVRLPPGHRDLRPAHGGAALRGRGGVRPAQDGQPGRVSRPYPR